MKSALINGQNVEVSAKTSELTAPPPGDDHASAGQWSQASPIAIDAGGNGATSAALTSGDTDLFSFVATQSGVSHIVGLPVNGAFSARIRIYNSAQSLITTGQPDDVSTDSVADVALTAGQTYYVLPMLAIANSGGQGNYTLTMQGRAVAQTCPRSRPQLLDSERQPPRTRPSSRATPSSAS